MSITELALKNKLSTYLLIGLMCVFGILAYNKAEKAEDPGFTVKTAVITTFWPGATADQVANLVSKKIEQEVRTMPSLDSVTSKNIAGQSNVYVNLKASYWDTFEPFQELINKINNFVVLPPDARKPIINLYFGDVFGTVISVHSETIPLDELYSYSEQLKNEIFYNAKEVSSIRIFGRQTEIIKIQIDNDRLIESGISLTQITRSLQEANLLEAGGSIQYHGNRITINPSGTFRDIDQIGDIVLRDAAQTGRVRLREIAKIEKGFDSPSSFKSFSQGEESIILAIALRKGDNILSLRDNVEKTIGEFRNRLPIGADISITYNQGNLVQEKIASFVASLLQAIIVIIVICYLFLGFRTSIIVASLTPTSIAGTFIVMGIMGYGINQMTLAGLIIALGMLVDTAVVMTDNIAVLCQKGMKKQEACIKAAKDLGLPLFAGAATTMAAMLPILLNRENMGEYVGPMAVVVIISLIVSWLINQILTPVLSDDFLDATAIKEVDLENDPMYIKYRNILIWSLKNPKKILIISIGSFFFGLMLLGFVNKNFLPDSNNPTMGTSIRMPKGTSIERSEEIVRDLGKFIKEELYVGDLQPKRPSILDVILTGGTTKNYDKEGILGWTSFVGGGGPRFVLGYTPEIPLPEYSYILSRVTDYNKIPEYAGKINRYLQENYPGIEVTSRILQTGSVFEYDISYVFKANNKEVLEDIKEEVFKKLRSIPEVRVVTDIAGNKVPEIIIDIDYNRAQIADVTTRNIADAIRFTLGEHIGSIFYDFDAPPDSAMQPIKIMGTRDLTNNLYLINSLVLQNSRGEKVPLNQVASLQVKFDYSMVYKEDMQDAILINAGIQTGLTSADVNSQIAPWIEKRMKEEWEGRGVRFDYSGLLRSSQNNSAGVAANLPIALLIVMLIVILQFNSIKKGLIIMSSIPLTILGVAIGLLITRLDFGFMALVGMISLAGVIVNQAIVLLDTFQNLEKDMTMSDAIVIGCQERLRPISLTTYTTLIGLLPLYLFGGPLFESLAIVVMVGLAFGTALTLLFIPVVYSLVFKVEYKNYQYASKMTEEEKNEKIAESLSKEPTNENTKEEEKKK